MAAIEDTPGTRAEQARMAQLASDADVLAACGRYLDWTVQVGMEEQLHGTAVTQMILFLRDALARGDRLRDALWPRIEEHVFDLEAAGRQGPEDLCYAATYVARCIQTSLELLDYDVKFLYMAEVLEAADKLSKTEDARRIRSAYAPLFFNVPGQKAGYAKMISGNPLRYKDGTSMSLEPDEGKRASIPFAQYIFGRSFPLGSRIDSIDGLIAWDEGAVIARGLSDYLSAPRSAGQLCSLLPPEGPSRVDWSRNDWVRDPRFQRWLSWEDYEDLFAPFDMMRAEPSRILAE